MKVKVCAKLNLSLDITGRTADYHLIDSVVATVDVYDVVEVNVSDETVVTCCGVEQCDNTAYKAINAFNKLFGNGNYTVNITKGIPFSAGMGGSSADASAVVYCLCKLNGISLDDERILQVCNSVGSDVNVLLHGGICRITGKGNDVEVLDYRKVFFVVSTFSVPMSARQVYAEFDNAPCCVTVRNDKLIDSISNGKDIGNLCVNKLQQAVQRLSNYADGYLACCNKLNVTPCMTGSGSAYFVPCASKQQAEQLCVALNNCGYNSFVATSTSQSITEL